jgi:hypothetical protein
MEDKTPVVVRPRSGSGRLRRKASIRLEGGAVVATDRLGRSRTFPIDGTDDSPSGFQYTRDLDDGGYYLEDRRGRSLVRLESMDWDIEALSALEEAAGFRVVSEPGSASASPGMMKIGDPPYFARASISAAVGISAVSLYWLHIAPEAIVLLVALPALILFVWFITLTKLAMPKREEVEAAAKRLHEARLRLDAETAEAAETSPVRAEPETDKP